MAEEKEKTFIHAFQQWTLGLHIFTSIRFNLLYLPTQYMGRGVGKAEGSSTYPPPGYTWHGSFGEYYTLMVSTHKTEGHGKICAGDF